MQCSIKAVFRGPGSEIKSVVEVDEDEGSRGHEEESPERGSLQGSRGGVALVPVANDTGLLPLQVGNAFLHLFRLVAIQHRGFGGVAGRSVHLGHTF